MKTREQKIQQALDFIRRKQRRAGPTIREVADAIGVYPNSVQQYVAELRGRGELEKESGDGLVTARPDPKKVTAEKAAFPLMEIKSRTHRPKVPTGFGGVPRKPLFKPSGKLT